jgi:signal transduction histidine kinase
LEFHFTALSLVSPQRNQFRYQLEGWDRDWQEAGAKRVAQYTRVRPGNYRFKVVAANNDGVWNEAGAMMAVVVLPPWWQTVWFRTFTALSVVLIVVGAYRMRVRRLESDRLAQQEFSRRLIESQELERQRIAAELHDSLGQSLLVIKSRALVALREENLPAPVTAQLDELITMAAGAIQEVREIAHNLRPFQLDELSLTRAVRGMLTNVTRAAGLNLEHDLANVDGAFALAEEINFYRIVQELLNNVVKHAKASGVRVTLKRDANAVRLTVTDNGRGYDTSTLLGGGFGLRGITERVRMLGGDWTVHSNVGKGTTVEVIVPIRPQPVSGNDPTTDEKRKT